jgi:hypothetical protein
MILGTNGNNIEVIGDTETSDEAPQPIGLNIGAAKMVKAGVFFQPIGLGFGNHVNSMGDHPLPVVMDGGSGPFRHHHRGGCGAFGQRL